MSVTNEKIEKKLRKIYIENETNYERETCRKKKENDIQKVRYKLLLVLIVWSAYVEP